MQYQIDQLRESILTDYTREMYGVDSSTTADDLFQILYLVAVSGKSILKITVLDPDGKPFKDMHIDVTKTSGNITDMTIGKNGSASIIANSSEQVTISVGSKIADVTGSISITASENGIVETSLPTQYVDYTEYKSSKEIILSTKCSRVDASLCGGGGGGGGGYYGIDGSGNGFSGGGGGGGGYGVHQDAVSFNANKKYNLVVGSGGTGKTTSQYSGGGFSDKTGGTGGSSSVFGLTANGGEGGKSITVTYSNPAGGVGNGNGGYGIANRYAHNASYTGGSGTSGSDYILTQDRQKEYIGGGGGGGSIFLKSTSATGSFTAESGASGSPNGGYGGGITFGTGGSSIKYSESKPKTSGGGYGAFGGQAMDLPAVSSGSSGGAGLVRLWFYH